MPRPTAALGALCAGLLSACGADPPAAPPGPERAERLRTTKMPAIDRPVMFNTPEADAILAALEVFPPDNPWNTPVDGWPLHPDSKAMIASVGADKPLRYNADMGFILVPPKQPKVEVRVTGYPDESDKGPFPVPDEVPIEGIAKTIDNPLQRLLLKGRNVEALRRLANIAENEEART